MITPEVLQEAKDALPVHVKRREDVHGQTVSIHTSPYSIYRGSPMTTVRCVLVVDRKKTKMFYSTKHQRWDRST